jgi:hypothetical protein
MFWNNFGGNQTHSEKFFNLQRKAIRIITHSRTRDSYRELFKRLEILPLYSQYIFSLSIFIVKNKHLFITNNQIHSVHTRFITNNQIHSVHTRFKTNLHPPTANLTTFQKGVYYSRIKFLTTFLMRLKIKLMGQYSFGML